MTTDYSYPVDFKVFYNNNKTYRKCMFSLFDGKSVLKVPEAQSSVLSELLKEENAAATEVKDDGDVDGEDEDDYDDSDYDDTKAKIALDYIYSVTKTNPLFRNLYSIGAAQFLSEDLEIGLPVLMCYDYLYCFHLCLVTFLTCPESFTAETPYYIELLAKMG